MNYFLLLSVTINIFKIGTGTGLLNLVTSINFYITEIKRHECVKK